MILTGHQPNYLPYLGFFDKVARADVVISNHGSLRETRRQVVEAWGQHVERGSAP